MSTIIVSVNNVREKRPRTPSRQGLIRKAIPGNEEPEVNLIKRGVSRARCRGPARQSTKQPGRASLVAQWLRICLPMQGTRVRALVWEDPTCRGATRPVSHNY